jgi:hypothetical protein
MVRKRILVLMSAIAVVSFSIAFRLSHFLCLGCADPERLDEHLRMTCEDDSKVVLRLGESSETISCASLLASGLPSGVTAVQLMVDSSRLPTLGLLTSYKYCWFVVDGERAQRFIVASCTVTTDGP